MNQTPEHRIDIHALLARIPLLQELTPQQIDQIAVHTREKRLAKGEMLFQKGDSSRGFYVVIFGQLKLAFPSSSGNEKVVDILGPKQSFGEALMFLDRPYPLFAEAIADTLLLFVTKEVVYELLGKDPTFARHMLAGLSMRLHGLLQDVESYSLRSSAQRVIGYLLQHCSHEDGAASQGSVEITLPTSKQIIASRLNLTPETLSRIFHDLAEAKLISVQGKQITINDLKRLGEYDL
jgi:CRP/FNR family transcriptional regulator, dissimilatory nitrate respiration regulator